MFEPIGITTTEGILLLGAVVGFVKFVQALAQKNWTTAITILGAAIIGGGLAAVGALPISILTGVVGGVAASGAYTISQLVGGEY